MRVFQAFRSCVGRRARRRRRSHGHFATLIALIPRAMRRAHDRDDAESTLDCRASDATSPVRSHAGSSCLRFIDRFVRGGVADVESGLFAAVSIRRRRAERAEASCHFFRYARRAEYIAYIGAKIDDGSPPSGGRRRSCHWLVITATICFGHGCRAGLPSGHADGCVEASRARSRAV